jgi:CRP/FNR family transcriptional regulator, cyclic AMP receptor protein
MVAALLAVLPAVERDSLLASARRRRFARREVLWHEDDPGDSLHLIETGRVAVRIGTADGHSATVAVLGPGDVVGELTVLDEAVRRTAAVVALEPTETLSFERDDIRRLVRTHPEIDGLLVGIVVSHLRRMDARLLEALFVPVDQRVLRHLLELSGDTGHPGEPGDTGDDAELRLTQADLALVVGTSRATVNRVLRQLEASGAVALTRGRIRVLDRQEITRRAH